MTYQYWGVHISTVLDGGDEWTVLEGKHFSVIADSGSDAVRIALGNMNLATNELLHQIHISLPSDKPVEAPMVWSQEEIEDFNRKSAQ